MRVRSSLLNFATMVMYLAVTTAVALWSTPRLLHGLGERRFGGFRVINDAYGYLMLLELGLGGAIGPLLARALSGDDRRSLESTLSAGMRGYLRVSAVTLAVGLALTPVIPWFAKDLAGPEVADLRVAWVVGLASFLSLTLLPMRTMIDARQLGYVVNLLLMAQSLLSTSLALVLASAGWGITGQAVSFVAGTLAMNVAMTLVVGWNHPGLIGAAIAAPPDPETRRAVRGLSLPTMMIHLSGRVSYLTDNLVIGAMLGTRNVNSLYNTQRLAGLGQMVLQGVGNAVWAGLAELHARGERETFNRRLVELTRLVGLLSVVGLVPVVAYNRAFLQLWLGLNGKDFTYPGGGVIPLAAVNVYFLAQLSLWNWCFSATGKVGRVADVAVIGAVANLAASIFLTKQVGLTGPLLGTFLAVLPVALFVLPARLSRDFGTARGPLTVALVVPFAWGLVAALALKGLVSLVEPRTWGGLALAMGLSALAVAAVSALLLTPTEREQWRQRFRAIRNKVPPPHHPPYHPNTDTDTDDRPGPSERHPEEAR